MIRAGILITLILSVLIPLGAETFEVLESTEDAVRIKFTLPDYSLKEIERGGANWQYIDCPEASVMGKAGEPEIPYFTGMVGVPPDGDIAVQLISSAPIANKDVRIVPALEPKSDGKSLTYRLGDISEVYNQNKPYPGQVVSKGTTGMSGDRRFYSFQVYPFQLMPALEELKVYDELIISITISGNKTRFRGTAAGSIFDRAGDLLLNDQYSRYWRQARIPSEESSIRTGETVNSFRLVIDKEGIYKVSYEYIIDQLSSYEYLAGFNWSTINPRYLELRDCDGTVPIYFSGESDGSFDPGDYFEFYADINHGETCWYDDYTSENVLYLSLSDNLGSRMMIENGGLVESNPDNLMQPESFEQTIHLEHQNAINHLGAQTIYDLDYFREDIWWWGEISAPDLKVFDFDLQYPHASNIRKATARVCLFGLTYDGEHPFSVNDYNKHRAVVRINSALVDDIGANGEWIGQREQIFENLPVTENQAPILNTDLYHGSNQVSISLPNLVNIREQVLFDYVDITYWREYKTDTDEIKFQKPKKKPIGTNQPFGLYQFDLEGFSSNDVSIYKIGASKIENLSALSLSEEGSAPYRISFQDSVLSDETEYLAVTEAGKLQPKSMSPDLPSNLKSGLNGSEYVIITVKDFAENGQLLADFWEEYNPGMNVEIVLLQDIFDEFNDGIRSPEAIRDFLDYTYNNWTPRPEYCLFLGEGLIDERDNSPYRWANKVPTKLVWLLSRGATASDNWYGCLVGNDDISDISISRLNVTNAAQILTVVDKTRNFMEDPGYEDMWHSSITLATGGKASEGNIFSMQSERIRNNSIPPGYRINRVYCNIQGMPEEYSGNTTTLINSINDGTLYVQFMGHGASNQWDDYDLFDIYDVANLNNERLFIASSMSCYGSAFFEGAGVSCIGEALTLDEQGAIAQIGFTGFGFLYQDEIYSKALLAAVTHPEVRTIGDIIDYTKTVFFAEAGYSSVSYSLLQSSALLGDPRVEIPLPEINAEIELNKYNFSKGDSLILTSQVPEDIIAGKYYLYNENDASVNANEFYPFTYQATNGVIERITQIADNSVLPDQTYSRTVKFFAHSPEREIMGTTNYTIGLPAAYDISWQPELPGPEEPIDIWANFYDEDGIDSVSCHIKIYDDNDDPFGESGIYASHYYQGMVLDAETDKYHLANPIAGLPNEYSVRFEFIIKDQLGNELTTVHLPNENFFGISGAKFTLSDFSISSKDNEPCARVSITNRGNRASEECSLKLYLGTMSLLDSIRVSGLGINEQVWQNLHLPELSGSYNFLIRINEEQEFPGTAQLSTNYYELQIFKAGESELTISSLDNNLTCKFPAGFLSEPATFSLIKIGDLSAMNQPDLSGIALHNGEISTAYELMCYSTDVLADTLGSLPANAKIELSFDYGNDTRRTQETRDTSRYSIYRWNDNYEKWVFMNMGADQATQTVSYLSGQCGTYTVWDNQDQLAPSIDVNVEGQEFTYGGYVSENGLISFLLSDKNGIDVIDHELIFSIDGALIEKEDYSINAARGRLTSVPVKYQMNMLPEGIHYLQMSCLDFNGNVFERELSFEVKADFDIVKIANYPNPVKLLTIDPLNSGRTRFTYVLTDDADDVKIMIYTVSGRLVKTFSALPSSIGYHEYPLSNIGWDCRDERGDSLANGIYFYKVIARKGNDKIERIQKMAILR